MTALDRLVATLELYAAGRVVERDLRRQMQGIRCTREEAQAGRCYNIYAPTTPEAYCPECWRRAKVWKLFKSRRAGNKALLRRVEALTLRLQVPEAPPEPEEPKRLLELMQ